MYLGLWSSEDLIGLKKYLDWFIGRVGNEFCYRLTSYCGCLIVLLTRLSQKLPCSAWPPLNEVHGCNPQPSLIHYGKEFRKYMTTRGGDSSGTIGEADPHALLSKCQFYLGSPEAQMKMLSDPGSLAAAETISLDRNVSKM